MTIKAKPATQAKRLLMALNREDAKDHAIKKLNTLKNSSQIADIEAAMFWREVVVQLLAY